MMTWDIPNRFSLCRLYPRFTQRCEPCCEPRCATRCEPCCEPRCATRCEPCCVTRCEPCCDSRCNVKCEPCCPKPCAKSCPGDDISVRVVGTDDCGNLILCVKRPRLCLVNGDWVTCRRFC